MSIVFVVSLTKRKTKIKVDNEQIFFKLVKDAFKTKKKKPKKIT